MIDARADMIRELLGGDATASPASACVLRLLDCEYQARRRQALLSDEPPTTRARALREIAACFGTRNLDLEALALLHLRYASPVQLSAREIADHLGIDARTLRRRQRRGYLLLARRLAPAAPDDPPNRAASPLGGLPRFTGALVGREAALDRLGEQLRRHRALVITGPAGVGKTRLAVEWASRQVDSLRDGIWFVPLRHLDDPALLAQAVARVISADPFAGIDRGRWQAALSDREGLLLLDRCEAIDGACAELVAELLQGCPGMRVLLTSRCRSPEAAAPRLDLEPLATPPLEIDAPQLLASFSGVRLFVDQVIRERPGFTLDATTGPQVAELVRRLGGLPLAIERAADRAAVLPLERVTRDPTSCMALEGPRAASPASMGSVAASLDALLPEDRRLLDRLAVFAGSFDLDAVRSICGGLAVDPASTDCAAPGCHVLERLARLDQLGLIQARREAGRRRLHLVEILHACAEDRLERSGEAEDLRRRHAEHYAELAETADRGMSGPEGPTWTTRLTLEHDNLLAALRWSQRQDPRLALRIAGRLGRFWRIGGCPSLGRRELEAALAGAEPLILEPGLHAMALTAAGDLARQQGDLEPARRHFEAAVALARRAGDRPALAAALRGLGRAATVQSRSDEACQHLQESLDLGRSLEGPWDAAATLEDLGCLALQLGHPVRAIELLQRAVAGFTRAADPRAQANARAALARALAASGRWQPAGEQLRLALAETRRLGDRHGIARCQLGRARVELGLGRIDRAWPCLREALAIIDDARDRRRAIEWLELAARLRFADGDLELAARALGAAERLAQDPPIHPPADDRAARQALAASLSLRLGPIRLTQLQRADRPSAWQHVADACLA
ncbi:MAG: tetratricopeptide repeat protein [Caldilineae bacterium]|nr:tetratricopeptide repeat protein [Caldilineae bacterium]